MDSKQQGCLRALNEGMKRLYSALLCIVVHPKCFAIMWGVSPQPPPLCSIHLAFATECKMYVVC